jgi:hypothetical protein
VSLHSEALYSNLLLDLSEQLPNTDLTVGEEWPGISPRERQATALLNSLLKKFKDGKEETADAMALEKFEQSNILCRDWELTLNTSGDEVLFGQFRQELYKFFTHRGHSVVSGAAQLAKLGNVGPGASVGARGNDFYTKLFSSPGACTSERIRILYEHYACKTSTWSMAESHRSSEFGAPNIVAGNRLSFVDKNATISRVICTEPSLNMFFQLGLGAVFEKRLSRYFGIDIRTQQDKNRELARVASINEDLCTIDLSAASDSVSLKMLEATLPEDIVQWLKCFRSPTVTLPDGRVEQLWMVSSMGNGFTFPLETIIFACVVAAVYVLEGIPLKRTTCAPDVSPRELAHYFMLKRRYGLPFPHDPSQVKWSHGNFGVFGDDIIAETRVAGKIIRLLNLLGFQVNSDKSFLEGPFRESCGADYFKGLPVRGIYLKTLRTQASRYVAINRLNEWSALTGFRLRRSIRYLHRHCRKLYVPLCENDDAGIKVPSRLLGKLGCETRDYSGVQGDPIFGVVKYKAWEPRKSQLRLNFEAQKVRGPGKTRIYNESGLMLAYLRGDIVNGAWNLRQPGEETKYRTKWRTVLYWDHTPTVGKQFPIGTLALAKAASDNLV